MILVVSLSPSLSHTYTYTHSISMWVMVGSPWNKSNHAASRRKMWHLTCCVVYLTYILCMGVLCVYGDVREECQRAHWEQHSNKSNDPNNPVNHHWPIILDISVWNNPDNPDSPDSPKSAMYIGSVCQEADPMLRLVLAEQTKYYHQQGHW